MSKSQDRTKELESMTDYVNLKNLKDNEVPNRDWRQYAHDRDSWLVVVAPHGGTIEPFTELIAVEIAGNDFSLFVFEGLRRKLPERKWLHVRSEEYEDSELKQLQLKSRVTLSIHGAATKQDKEKWPNLPEKVTHMGGNNEDLRDLIWNSLNKNGFEAVLGEHHLAGRHKDNFVNRHHRGVQLEISRAERDALADNPVRRNRYINAIREALLSYTPPDSDKSGPTNSQK